MEEETFEEKNGNTIKYRMKKLEERMEKTGEKTELGVEKLEEKMDKGFSDLKIKLEEYAKELGKYNREISTYIEVHKYSEEARKSLCRKEFEEMFVHKERVNDTIKKCFEEIEDKKEQKKERNMSILQKIVWLVLAAGTIIISINFKEVVSLIAR